MLLSGFVCRMVCKECFIKVLSPLWISVHMKHSLYIHLSLNRILMFSFWAIRKAQWAPVFPELTCKSGLVHSRIPQCLKSHFRVFSPLIYFAESTIKTIVHCFELWLSILNLDVGSASYSAWAYLFCLHIALILDRKKILLSLLFCH